jgi:hypothetical protein
MFVDVFRVVDRLGHEWVCAVGTLQNWRMRYQ